MQKRFIALIIVVILLVLAIVLTVWKIMPLNISGPVIGALLSVMVVMVYNITEYYSSTSKLKFGGLSLEVLPSIFSEGRGSQVLRNRVSALIKNDGDVIVKNARATLTIKVRDSNKADGDYNLKDLLLPRDDEAKYYGCSNYLLTESYPIVTDGSLSWVLPDEVNYHPLAFNYKHSATITPKSSNKLLIFDYTKLNDENYVIGVYSEYGGVGYRDLLPALGRLISSSSEANNMVKNIIRTIRKVTNCTQPKDSPDSTEMPQDLPNLLSVLSSFIDCIRQSSRQVDPSDDASKLVDSVLKVLAIPYRVCLRLDKGKELIFEINVYGENARDPLNFKLRVNVNNLNALDDALRSQNIDNVKEALKNMKCS